jgi:transgelin
LANKIQPGSVKNISKQKMAFMQMENINAFLKACSAFGVPKHDLFMTVDLYEGKNMIQVVDTIYSLGSVCQKMKGYKGPVIGTKRSDKTEYTFTEEQLQKSRAIPTFMSEASLKSETQFDNSRNVVKTTEKSVSGAISQQTGGSIKGDTQFDNSRNVVKTTNKSVSGAVSQQSGGSIKGDTQFDTSRNVVKTTSKPVSGAVSQQSGGSIKGDTQYDTSRNVVKVKQGNDDLEQLEKLATLRDKGILTEEEFQAKKKQILGL